MIKPVLTVAPAALPVTLAEVLTYLRVTSSDENALVTTFMQAAVGHLDGWSGILGRCIMPQTWRLDMDGFPGTSVRLPFPDVQSVVVSYTDPAGATQTLDPSTYHLSNTFSAGLLTLADGASWPALAVRPDAVRISMVCGYETVPPEIKVAILMHVGAMYENPASLSDPSLAPSPYNALIAGQGGISV